jgi:glutamine---fructose-6-phosphate transaminase (isomerizing)
MDAQTSREWPKLFVDKHHALFLGRGALNPVAIEGALKLKEISVHTRRGLSAGELKHGPLALVDDDMPVIAVAPNDDLLEKLGQHRRRCARAAAQLVVFADPRIAFDEEPGVTVLRLPVHAEPLQAPLIYTIPLQLLAYHVAVLKGTDVDQPRNLAKSVTVE